MLLLDKKSVMLYNIFDYKNTRKDIVYMADRIVDKKNVTSTVDGDFIIYKNRPLVREDNVICYGNLSDRYIIKMIIMTEKEFRGHQVPDQIYVQLLESDNTDPSGSKVIKEGMKSGLYNALDIGIAWLDRYTSSNN